MSNISPTEYDFDFWEFIACTKCQLPFTSESGATIPFWLTECGHVVCNNHLNPDQSCAKCRSQAIHLVPLQHQLDAPMSNWFRSIPHSLDEVAFAVRFQQETMAAQIRHYRKKHQEHRAFIERLKSESLELKKANEVLTRQISHLRQRMEHQQQSHRLGGREDREPSDAVNSNGKRQMIDMQRYDDNGPRTSSSPRSIVTPLGPNRLTLPPGQRPPSLSSRHDQGNDASSSRPRPLAPGNNSANINHAQQRPGSSRFIEQYAYVPPATTQSHPKQASHIQAPNFPQRTKANEEQQQHSSQTRSRQHMQAPPSSLSKFKPSQGRMPLGSQRIDPSAHSIPTQMESQYQDQGQNHGQVGYQDSRRTAMGPPPTPQLMQPIHANAATLHSNADHPPPVSHRPANAISTSNRFLPSAQRLAPSAPIINQGQRLITTPSTRTIHRFYSENGDLTSVSHSGSRAPSRAAVPSMSGGGQRRPFVPGAPGEFG